MTKKKPKQAPCLQRPFLDKLDFTTTQKQVDAIVQTVLYDKILNENKIRFIKEQLYDQRYQINPKIIACKIAECIDELYFQEPSI